MTAAVPQGITEDDIASYLANTPAFFERHAELLASIQLQSPFGQRAVSLQERQMEMLRERIKGLEKKIVEMIRNGQDNVAIADRLHRWTRALMLTPDARNCPRCCCASCSSSSSCRAPGCACGASMHRTPLCRKPRR